AVRGYARVSCRGGPVLDAPASPAVAPCAQGGLGGPDRRVLRGPPGRLRRNLHARAGPRARRARGRAGRLRSEDAPGTRRGPAPRAASVRDRCRAPAPGWRCAVTPAAIATLAELLLEAIQDLEAAPTKE